MSGADKKRIATMVVGSALLIWFVTFLVIPNWRTSLVHALIPAIVAGMTAAGLQWLRRHLN